MTTGSQIQSKESFLYGRFETMIKPAYGSGIVSSFFLFNDDKGFQKNWQEIDFEFLGRHTNTLDTNAIHTVKGATDKNKNVKHIILNKRSSDVYWKLCIEWTPTKITWKIDDIIIRSMVVKFSKPMKIMANIWNGGVAWAGEMNTGLLPQAALYEYIRISSYVNGEFVFLRQDSFDSIDESKWYFPEFLLGNTNLIKNNASIDGDKLKLRLT